MGFIEIDRRRRDDEWSMSDLQSHDYFELYFLLQGTRSFFLKDKIFNISAPTVCIIPPFCLHKTQGDKYERINVNVSSDLLSEGELERLCRLGKTVVFKLAEDKNDLVIKLLQNFGACENEKQSSELMTSFLHVLLHLLNDEQLIPYEFKLNQSTKSKDGFIMKVVTYVNEHFNEDFMIEDLCRMFFISKNSLCQKFRKTMHCSVMEYRLSLRISKAKELLSNCRLSLDEVAQKCGFSSANYFSLIFKSKVGISPMGYRKTK